MLPMWNTLCAGAVATPFPLTFIQGQEGIKQEQHGLECVYGGYYMYLFHQDAFETDMPHSHNYKKVHYKTQLCKRLAVKPYGKC